MSTFIVTSGNLEVDLNVKNIVYSSQMTPQEEPQRPKGPGRGVGGGRPALPEHKKRVAVYGKILPSTRQFLESMEEPNLGRAVDTLVLAWKRLKKRGAWDRKPGSWNDAPEIN